MLDTTCKISIQTNLSLESFLSAWNEQYCAAASKIKLFDPSLTSQWTQQQKQFFVKIFYHARGHFHDFLWYLGNHAPTLDIKKIVMSNIAEEFGYHGSSHEQLYFDFAKELGVNLQEEFKSQSHYLNFLKEFNAGHLNFLVDHDWDRGFSAFAAYERLDNIDYNYLVELAESLNISKKGLLFFKVHQHVTHFDTTKEVIEAIWNQDSIKVKDGFNFIATHQLKLWTELSEHVFALS